MPSMSPARAATVAATMVLIWLATSVDAALRVRRESCRARHLVRVDETTDGRCMPVHECLESLKDVGRLKFPHVLRRARPAAHRVLPEQGPSSDAGPSDQQVLHLLHRRWSPQPPSQPVVREPPAGTPCTVAESGQPGACVPLSSCEPLQEQVRQKKFPSLCDLKGGVAYACCPRAQPQVSTTTARPPLERAVKIAGLKYENGKYCGKTPNKPGHIDFRPVVKGGKDAELGSYPFMVAVFRDNVRVLNFWCGGALILGRVVLSAAHCYYDTLHDTRYIVRIGGVSISDGSTEPVVERHVESVHVHPDYDERFHYNDVALLFLNRSALQYIKKPVACLPEPNAAPDAQHGTVLGWGHDDFGGRLQTVLQEAMIPLVDNPTCERAYTKLNSFETEVPSRHQRRLPLCREHHGRRCGRLPDSGGPLVTNSTRDGRNFFETIGIVSFGVGCGSAAYPGVYTRVSKYVDWILNVMADVIPDEQIYV
ncbi:hypothetical protein MTO96_048392 [Rhipicephalus appendiculatus]